MNNTNDTQTGLASLLEGTTPGPWIEYRKDTLVDLGNGDGPIPMVEILGHYNEQTGDGGTVAFVFSEANARAISALPALASCQAELVTALRGQAAATAYFNGKPAHMWEYYLTDAARAALDNAKLAGLKSHG